MLADRLTAQLLAGDPARDPVAVARQLLAIQAQDPRGARLAIRARTDGVSGADVDRALTVDRTLVVDWLNRGTLHLICSEDYAWLHALTTPPLFAASARRLRQEGVTEAAAERGVATIERALSDEGPLTRAQLRELVAAAGVRTEGQAFLHLLFLASLRGIAVRGPMIGRQHAYVLVRDWIELEAVPNRDSSLSELARRYLAGHGPAGDRDLARWAGLPLRDARAALEAIAPALDQRDDGLVDLRARSSAAELPPPRLLGAFEPVLLGWRSREPILGRHESAVVNGGMFRPIALAGGRAVGVWRLRDGEVELSPFGRLPGATAKALEADAVELTSYLGEP